jgi:hypothetical protein
MEINLDEVRELLLTPPPSRGIRNNLLVPKVPLHEDGSD